MNLENQPRGQPDWRDCWWTPMTQILINELREPTWRPAWLARLLVDTDDTKTPPCPPGGPSSILMPSCSQVLSMWIWRISPGDGLWIDGKPEGILFFSVKRKASLESREEGSWIFLYFFYLLPIGIFFTLLVFLFLRFSRIHNKQQNCLSPRFFELLIIPKIRLCINLRYISVFVQHEQIPIDLCLIGSRVCWSTWLLLSSLT